MYNMLSNAIKKLDIEFIDALIEREYLSPVINWSTGDVQITDLYITPYIMEQMGYFRVILVVLSVLTSRYNANIIYPIEDRSEYSEVLKYFVRRTGSTCTRILKGYYYPYEEKIESFFKYNKIPLKEIVDKTGLYIYMSTASDDYLELPNFIGDFNRLEIHGSFLPNLTIVQYPQPETTGISKVYSAERLIRLVNSNTKVALIGHKEWLYQYFRTTLELSYSSLTLEEDYVGSDIEAYSSLTNTLLNNSLLKSQYPNNCSPTVGISRVTNNSQELASLTEEPLCKPGLIALHVLDSVHDQKIQKIKDILEQSPGGFFPICVKSVSQTELEASLSEIEAVNVPRPYCILSTVRLTSTESKLISLDKKTGITIQIEKSWEHDSPDILTSLMYQDEHIESLKEFKSLPQRYEVLIQNLESILAPKEYVLYIIGPTGESFDCVKGVTGVPDKVTEGYLSKLKKGIKTFKGSTDFSYVTNF